VHTIITFGAESASLYAMCSQVGVSSYACTTLKEAVQRAFQIAPQNSIVLFSPAGSSYDQFKNYEERGNVFKDTVSKIQRGEVISNIL
jgi:UDP-N-acetylmuramoylalanine--D-glutamate ligase